MSEHPRILIVDDEPAVAESIGDLLDLKGYEIIIAGNGADGLKILTETRVDLVVLDLAMPRMDGYMFLEHAHKRWKNDNRKFPFPKVLVITALDKQTDLGLAENLGATKLMHKPYKQHDLLTAVESLLE